jgi:hypothetical protein
MGGKLLGTEALGIDDTTRRNSGSEPSTRRRYEGLGRSKRSLCSC